MKLNAEYHPSTEDMFFLMRGGDVDPEFACWFARYYMKRRWLEMEPFIMKDARLVLLYAQEVIKGRWPEAEIHLMKNPWFLYLYANDVIKGRWLEAEEIIKQDLDTVLYYARDVIKDRWLEMEPIILTEESCVSELYLFYFPEAQTYSKDVPVVINNHAIMDIPNSVTDQQLIEILKIISSDLTVEEICERDIRVKRMLFEPSIRKCLKEKRFIETTLTTILNLDDDHLYLLMKNIFPNKIYHTDFR